MNNSLYGKLCTMIYDLDKPFATNEEIEIYTKFIKQKSDKILEPMCGSGRFLIPLLKEGYDISGFDLSKEMLEACKLKCDTFKLHPTLFQADIVNLNYFEKYKYIFIPIGSISLLINDPDLKRAFKNIWNILEEGGVFIFSFLGFKDKIDDQTEWTESIKYIYKGKEIICKYKSIFDSEKSIINMKLLYQLKSEYDVIEEEYQDFPFRLFTITEMTDMLQNNGFKNIEKLNGMDPKNECNIMKAEK